MRIFLTLLVYAIVLSPLWVGAIILAASSLN